MQSFFQEQRLGECFIGNKQLFQEMQWSCPEGNIYFNLLSTLLLSGKVFYPPSIYRTLSPLVITMRMTGGKTTMKCSCHNSRGGFLIEGEMAICPEIQTGTKAAWQQVRIKIIK